MFSETTRPRPGREINNNGHVRSRIGQNSPNARAARMKYTRYDRTGARTTLFPTQRVRRTVIIGKIAEMKRVKCRTQTVPHS